MRNRSLIVCAVLVLLLAGVSLWVSAGRATTLAAPALQATATDTPRPTPTNVLTAVPTDTPAPTNTPPPTDTPPVTDTPRPTSTLPPTTDTPPATSQPPATAAPTSPPAPPEPPSQPQPQPPAEQVQQQAEAGAAPAAASVPRTGFYAAGLPAGIVVVVLAGVLVAVRSLRRRYPKKR